MLRSSKSSGTKPSWKVMYIKNIVFLLLLRLLSVIFMASNLILDYNVALPPNKQLITTTRP